MFRLWRSITTAHRSDDDTNRGRLVEFIFPRLTGKFFIRLGCVALAAWICFGVFLMPCIIDGESMMPTYDRKGFTFCKKWSYWFSAPERGDIVIVEYVDGMYLLKRIVALEGDTVEFRKGTLFVNDVEVDEPYVRYASNWNLPPRTVKAGKCYVIGDNRSQMLSEHIFGQTDITRIKGKPLF